MKIENEKPAIEIIIGPNKNDRILLADDSPDAVNLMKKALENSGYEVVTTINGTECFEKFIQSDFQMVVLDFQMPGSNGIETLRRIRKHRNPEELPVVMITAKQSKDLLKSAIRSGVNDFILKPFLGSDLSKRVEKILVKLTEEQISRILMSLNVADMSTLDGESKKTLSSKGLTSYPFTIGHIKCCAILKLGINPHIVSKHSPQKMADELVLIAKGGFLWNTIWPRQLKSKFSVTKHVFNDNTDLSELLDSND
jgi:two-component system chemotaxis response regulator CheY